MKRLLRTLMLLLVRLVGAPAAYRSRQEAHKGNVTAPRILLVRPDHLGDLVMATPILQALRDHAPDAQITMMVGPWSSELVARHAAIDRLITCAFPSFTRGHQNPFTPYMMLFRTAQQLQRQHYDLAINLRPDFWWGAALLYLAHIPRRIGYALQPGTPFLTEALPFPTREHASVSNVRLASAGLRTIGYAALEEPYTPARYPLQFMPTTEERNWIAGRLLRDRIDVTTRVVVIHAGTGGAVKLWRTEAWSNVANWLVQSKAFSDPVRIILTGSKGERPMLEEIAEGMLEPPVLLTDTTVGQLAALLERAALVLGVDNGPLHLATAQGTPTVRIFGPTDARIFGPWGAAERNIVIASTQRCPGCPTIPCGHLDFSADELAEHPCVRVVAEKRVEEAVAAIVETGRENKKLPK